MEEMVLPATRKIQYILRKPLVQSWSPVWPRWCAREFVTLHDGVGVESMTEASSDQTESNIAPGEKIHKGETMSQMF